MFPVDNVHFQQAAKLNTALVDEQVDFEAMVNIGSLGSGEIILTPTVFDFMNEWEWMESGETSFSAGCKRRVLHFSFFFLFFQWYTDKDHSLKGAVRHVYALMSNFLKKCLVNDK